MQTALMRWIASSARNNANGTLENGLSTAADPGRAHSGLKSRAKIVET
jgi:hypothetical protein